MMGHCLPIIVILFFFKTHFSTRSLMFLFSQPDDLCVFREDFGSAVRAAYAVQRSGLATKFKVQQGCYYVLLLHYRLGGHAVWHANTF